MKIFTEKQFNKLINKIQVESFNDGYKEGCDIGLHKGLTSNKEGIHLNNNGLYFFKDNKIIETTQENKLN